MPHGSDERYSADNRHQEGATCASASSTTSGENMNEDSNCSKKRRLSVEAHLGIDNTEVDAKKLNGHHGSDVTLHDSIDERNSADNGNQEGATCASASSTTSGETTAANSPNGFRFSDEPTLETIRRLQAAFVEERNWNQYHTPRNLLLAMVGEVGEVSELFQWRGETRVGLPDWTEQEKNQLSQELSDVLIYLVRLAEQCHIDLPTAVLSKMALNRLKYPVDKVYGSSKKYTEYTDEKE